MHVPKAYSSCSSSMRQRVSSRRLLFPSDFQIPPKNPSMKPSNKPFSPDAVYDAWLSSRELPAQKGTHLVPGAPRPLTVANGKRALFIAQACTLDFLSVLWGLNPLRTTLMMALNIIRSLFPAFRGYSQALIVDELQSLIASESFTWSRLLYLISTEILRRIIEGLLDSFAASNENVVMSSARFFVEYKQMEHRVRLDVPTLSDPLVRDLLHESDLFARSFSGGGFGILSPLDFVHILSLMTEIASHVLLIVSLTRGATHFFVLLLSVFTVLLPLMLSWCSWSPNTTESPTSAKEARAADRQERMRNLAYSDIYRPEIALFGLGDWILKSWSNSRKIVLASEQPYYLKNDSWAHFNFSELLFALQNIPLLLLLQTSAASLGSVTAYRSSIQSLLFASRNLVTTTKMAFQGIFLMSAFCASMKLKPRLQPKLDDTVKYSSRSPGGMKIDVRGLSYTYPGSHEPALKNVNFSIKAGETLAVVGYNGSGKSTLAKILLRIVDFERGSLFINGIDIRRYNPVDFHRHLTAVFQGFSKFNSTVKENVGIGNIDKMSHRPSLEEAIHLAEADNVVESLPNGLKTQLESPAFESVYYPGSMGSQHYSNRHGLSGGEWQRIAIARAFMRAGDPDVDLLVFDEPTSSLDGHAQNQIFDTIERLSKTPTGERCKTVIFITHRLSTARRADKVAMMEDGTISEFGTHEELMEKNGAYAALYRASV